MFTAKKHSILYAFISSMSMGILADCLAFPWVWETFCSYFIESVFKLLAWHSPFSTSVIHRFALFIVSHRSFLLHLYFLINLSQMSLLTANSFTLPPRPNIRSSPQSILSTGCFWSFPLADLRNKSREFVLAKQVSSTELSPQPPKLFIGFIEYFISSISVSSQCFLFLYWTPLSQPMFTFYLILLFVVYVVLDFVAFDFFGILYN